MPKFVFLILGGLFFDLIRTPDALKAARTLGIAAQDPHAADIERGLFKGTRQAGD